MIFPESKIAEGATQPSLQLPAPRFLYASVRMKRN